MAYITQRLTIMTLILGLYILWGVALYEKFN